MGESIQSFLQQLTEQVFQVLRQRQQWEGKQRNWKHQTDLRTAGVAIRLELRRLYAVGLGSRVHMVKGFECQARTEFLTLWVRGKALEGSGKQVGLEAINSLDWRQRRPGSGYP